MRAWQLGRLSYRLITGSHARKARALFEEAEKRGPGGANNPQGLGGHAGKVADIEIVNVYIIHLDKEERSSGACPRRRVDSPHTRKVLRMGNPIGLAAQGVVAQTGGNRTVMGNPTGHRFQPSFRLLHVCATLKPPSLTVVGATAAVVCTSHGRTRALRKKSTAPRALCQVVSSLETARLPPACRGQFASRLSADRRAVAPRSLTRVTLIRPPSAARHSCARASRPHPP